jgi:hypothetical protein
MHRVRCGHGRLLRTRPRRCYSQTLNTRPAKPFPACRDRTDSSAEEFCGGRCTTAPAQIWSADLLGQCFCFNAVVQLR